MLHQLQPFVQYHWGKLTAMRCGPEYPTAVIVHCVVPRALRSASIHCALLALGRCAGFS
jgi:hypothetical protein